MEEFTKTKTVPLTPEDAQNAYVQSECELVAKAQINVSSAVARGRGKCNWLGYKLQAYNKRG